MAGFIIDLGQSFPYEIDGEKKALPRFGYWAYDTRKEKHQCIECHDDVDYLRKKYSTDIIVTRDQMVLTR